MGTCSRFKMGIQRSFNVRVTGRETLVPLLSKLTRDKKAFPVVNRIIPLKQGVNISSQGSRVQNHDLAPLVSLLALPFTVMAAVNLRPFLYSREYLRAVHSAPSN